MDNKIPTIKILLIGSTGAGKTSLLNQYRKSGFILNRNTTVGVDFQYDKNISINNKIYNFAIWDTAGQEKYMAIVHQSVRDSDGALLCFDLNDANSLNSIKQWITFLQENCPRHIYIVMVGTKSDLPPQHSKAKLDEHLQILRKEHKQELVLMTTSARNNEGVSEAFRFVYEKSVYAKENYVASSPTRIRQLSNEKYQQNSVKFSLKSSLTKTEHIYESDDEEKQNDKKSESQCYC